MINRPGEQHHQQRHQQRHRQHHQQAQQAGTPSRLLIPVVEVAESVALVLASGDTFTAAARVTATVAPRTTYVLLDISRIK